MKRRPDQYRASPCAGREKLNLPRGHVYIIEDPKGKDLGAMSLENAQKKYGEDKIFISNSDTLCNNCYNNIWKEIQSFKR